MRRALVAIAALALAASPATTRGDSGAAGAAGTTSATGAAGPRDRAPSPTATRVDDVAALIAALAKPDGPAEIELSPGVYKADLRITRPLVLRGLSGVVLEGTGGGTVVTVDASNVTIENVVIRRSGRRHTAEDAGLKATGREIHLRDARVEDTLFGVELSSCQRCSIERVAVLGFDDATELRGDAIKLWEAHDSVVRGCHLERSRDMVVWYTRRATLEDNVVTRGRYGLHFMYAHDSIARRNRFDSNVVGIFVMYSGRLRIEENLLAGARGAAGVGLGFKDSDALTVRANWLVANTTGTYLDNTPRTEADPVRFDGNVVALNDVALRLHGGDKGLHFGGNDFHGNALLVEVDGGGTALSVDFAGNHYGDYEGYDLDRDGTGDVAYEVKALSSELAESRPSLKFFHGTAAMGLFDAVAHAVPVLAARKLLSDPRPLVRSPAIAEPPVPPLPEKPR